MVEVALAEKIILGISGRLQSGKSVTADFIYDRWESTPHGYVSVRSLSMPLKTFCVDILGLTDDQVCGGDAEKNSLTDLLWENFPVLEAVQGRTGRMTARDVMDMWGTWALRKANPNCFIDKLMRDIDQHFWRLNAMTPYYTKNIEVIPDVRFPNEVDKILDAEGYVLRLTRQIVPNETRASETALDPDKFDWGRFSLVFDNGGLTVEQQMAGLTPWLKEIGVL